MVKIKNKMLYIIGKMFFSGIIVCKEKINKLSYVIGKKYVKCKCPVFINIYLPVNKHLPLNYKAAKE